MTVTDYSTPLEAALRHPILSIFVLTLGASIGSFLNVVIYRLPLNLSVGNPKRSFCPNCEKQIPSWQNIPILSWILLRGKCAKCRKPISARYLLIELLTMFIFFAVWWKFLPFGWGVPVVMWVFVSLLIASTFIDLEHQIIPDGLTWKAAIVGIGMMTLLPLVDGWFPQAGILNEAALAKPGDLPNASWFKGLRLSLFGAIVGYGLIWSVVKLGNMAFGKKGLNFEEDTEWRIHEPSEDAPPQLEAGDHVQEWDHIFGSDKDRILIEGDSVTIHFVDGKKEEIPAERTIEVFHDRLVVDGAEHPLEGIKRLSGLTRSIIQPRVAMGMGDVKFVAMIGAFLGWPATVFSLMGGSFVGAIVGLLQRVARNEKFSRPIPFGPYLALAAFAYLFIGTEMIQWYLSAFRVR